MLVTDHVTSKNIQPEKQMLPGGCQGLGTEENEQLIIYSSVISVKEGIKLNI